MNELIKITENNGQRAVSARELHSFLESKQDFSNWMKNRITKYGLIENEDYVVFNKVIENLSGGRPTIEYALSIDAAKELSMVEGNAKGKQARQYFIACEKKSMELAKPLTQIEILIQSAQLIQAQEQRLGLVENKIQELNARTQASPDLFTIAGYASLIGISINLQNAVSLGKKATRLCEIEKLSTGTIPDPRFGRVKTYPTHILKRVFETPIN